MYKDKRILVIGAARSGIAAANMLSKLGVDVTLNDIKTKKELKESLSKLDKNVKLKLNLQADILVKDYDLIVVSPGIPTKLSFFDIARENNILIISEIELAYSVCRAKIIAVTGTNGKTTTTSLIGEIFKRAGFKTFVAGNIGDAFSNCVLEAGTDDIIVLEVSSFQLENIKTFKPDVSLILNISEDHIDRHGDIECYIDAKKRIYENQNDDDILILNYDNEYTLKMGENVKAKTIYFSTNKIEGDSVCIDDTHIVLNKDSEIIKICRPAEIKLPGKHNLENTLGAIACACFLGIEMPLSAVRMALATYEGVEHRLEFVSEYNQVKFINDSKATNINAAVCAIESMEMPTIIILGGYDKKLDFEPLVKAFTKYISGAVVLGETQSSICEELDKAGFTNYTRAMDLNDGVRTAFSMAEPGYNVLLSPACASYDMFDDYEQRGRMFKNIVRSIAEVKI